MKKQHNYYSRFQNAFNKIIKKICADHGFVHIQIITEWPHIVGEQLSAISTPILVYFPFNDDNNGTIVCGINNPSYALRIQMQSKTIIQRINTYFGYNAIANLKCKFSPNINRKIGNNYSDSKSVSLIKKNQENLFHKEKIESGDWLRIENLLKQIDDEDLGKICKNLALSLFDIVENKK